VVLASVPIRLSEKPIRLAWRQSSTVAGSPFASTASCSTICLISRRNQGSMNEMALISSTVMPARKASPTQNSRAARGTRTFSWIWWRSVAV